jgi:hypothetical protein
LAEEVGGSWDLDQKRPSVVSTHSVVEINSEVSSPEQSERKIKENVADGKASPSSSQKGELRSWYRKYKQPVQVPATIPGSVGSSPIPDCNLNSDLTTASKPTSPVLSTASSFSSVSNSNSTPNNPLHNSLSQTQLHNVQQQGAPFPSQPQPVTPQQLQQQLQATLRNSPSLSTVGTSSSFGKSPSVHSNSSTTSSLFSVAKLVSKQRRPTSSSISTHTYGANVPRVDKWYQVIYPPDFNYALLLSMDPKFELTDAPNCTFVVELSTLSTEEIKRQEVIYELICTEEVYIADLELIIQVLFFVATTFLHQH